MTLVEGMLTDPEASRDDDAAVPFDHSVRFAMDLGRALHRFGTPAHRLEGVMTAVAAQLGLVARFVSTPTAIFASFGPAEALRSTLIRVDPGELDLDRLARLDALTSAVLARRISIDAGTSFIAGILASPPIYSRLVTALCSAMAAAAAAQLFGGGWREMLVALALGLAIAALAQTTTRVPGLGRCFELLAAFVAAAGALVAVRVIGPYATSLATLAALIGLLPGLTLAVAMTELATRNLISGTARLAGAAVVLLQLGFGVALGQRVEALLPGVEAAAPPVPLPSWTALFTLAAITLALAVVVRAQLRDTGFVLLAAIAAYSGSRFGAHVLGPELGAFTGAFALGVGSNLLARLRNQSSLITIVPGVMLLVPGSMGFHSVEALMAQDVVGGLAAAFAAAIVLVGIAGGLLLASSVLPPRHAL